MSAGRDLAENGADDDTSFRWKGSAIQSRIINKSLHHALFLDFGRFFFMGTMSEHPSPMHSRASATIHSWSYSQHRQDPGLPARISPTGFASERYGPVEYEAWSHLGEVAFEGLYPQR